jgi:hypothetical protein
MGYAEKRLRSRWAKDAMNVFCLVRGVCRGVGSPLLCVCVWQGEGGNYWSGRQRTPPGESVVRRKTPRKEVNKARGEVLSYPHQWHRCFGPGSISVRSDLAERELGLFLINRNRNHFSTLHVHRIVRKDGQPIPPPQRARGQLKRHLEHVRHS